MLNINGINFADTIMVLYKLKEKRNHKTLQETYRYLESEDIDTILDVLVTSYNVANNTQLDDIAFGEVLGSHNIGFVKLAFNYRQVIETMLYSGADDNDKEQLKNLTMNLKKTTKKK